MFNRLRFCSFLLCLLVLTAHSQQPGQASEIAKINFRAKQVIPPAPEAAELGKYGNVPVSLFTGTPNISIPLFELKGANFSLPITLSYNASGFKPEDQATWVGSGWSLNAGGVVTRAVLGNPDNETNYFGSAAALHPPSSSDVVAYKKYIQKIQNGIIESQPDMYYYNFAGHTGKFIITPEQAVFRKEKDLMVITPCVTCNESSFSIVDEQGNTYTFSDVEMTRSIPTDDIGQSSYIIYNYPSAWYLTAITSTSGDRFDFEYYDVDEQTLYQNMVDNKTVNYTYGVISVGACGSSAVNNSETVAAQPPTVSIKRKFIKRILQQRNDRLVATIEFSSTAGVRQDVDFAGDRLLNQCSLYTNAGASATLIKSFQFSYGYFSNGANVKRLRLDEVQELGKDGRNTRPPYVFKYNTGSTIPPRFTTALDHWGFYNEATDNQTLVPNIQLPFRTAGTVTFPARTVGGNANREPTLSGSSATLLNSIQYPTGGYTSFIYELNDARFEDGTVHPVGGVRIKQITDFSAQDKKATDKRYLYSLDDGSTSGVAGKFPVYQVNSTFRHYSTPFVGNACNDVFANADYSLSTISMSAHSVFGLGTFQGSHVGYSQVTELQTDVSTMQALGRTVFNYNTQFRTEDDDELANGDLVRQRVYNSDEKLLQETVNEYTYSNLFINTGFKTQAADLQTNKTHWCKTSAGAFVNYCSWENPPNSCLEGGEFNSRAVLLDYNITAQNKRLTKQEFTTFDQLSGQYLRSTKAYAYGNSAHNYPTAITETTSGGQQLLTNIKYADDYTLSSTSTGQASHIKELIAANIHGVAIEKLQLRQNPDGTNVRYVSGELTDYVLSKPVAVYSLEIKQPLTTISTSTINAAGSFIQDAHYRLVGRFWYDNNNNLISQSKNSDLPTTYLWDYGYQYPVAEVKNALPDQVAYSSFETTSKGNFNYAGSVTADAYAPTGKLVYTLTGKSITAPVNSGTIYTVSYWSKNTSSNYSVSGSSTVKKGSSYNGWTYYEHTVTGVTTITVSGTGLIDELRLYPKTALMSTSSFDPMVGATSKADPANRIIYYEYDGSNRLENIRDERRSIIKHIAYNYGTGGNVVDAANSLYYNVAAEKPFTKEGCAIGSPTVVTYKVPFGRYISAEGQAAADAKALADIAANGQSFANTNGSCVFYNERQSRRFFRNNCNPDDGLGLPFTYVVPAGKYSALTQSAANALALDDILANGQEQANLLAQCSCGAEYQKMIDGTCVTGTRVNDGSYQEGTVWKCVYHYEFPGQLTKGPFYSYSSAGACPLGAQN